MVVSKDMPDKTNHRSKSLVHTGIIIGNYCITDSLQKEKINMVEKVKGLYSGFYSFRKLEAVDVWIPSE